MRTDLLCMICCHSYQTPLKEKGKEGTEEDHEQNDDFTEDIVKFGEQVLIDWQSSSKSNGGNGEGTQMTDETEDSEEIKHLEMKSKVTEILESCKPLNISICLNCVRKMKNVTSARAQAVRLEERVWKLQLILLKNLKRLQRQMERFWEEVKKIEVDVSNADTFFLETDLMRGARKTYGKNQHAAPENQLAARRKQVFEFRHQILEVARDLQNYQFEVSKKFGSVANREKEDVESNAGDKKEHLPDIEIKEEMDDDVNPLGDSYEFQPEEETEYEDPPEAGQPLVVYPETASRPRSNVDDENQGSVWSDAEMDDEMLDYDDEEEDDEEYDPRGRAKKKTSEEKRQASILKRMPAFTKSVISRVFQQVSRNLNKGWKNLNLFQKSLKDLEYDQERKLILLRDEVIHILDKKVNPKVENGLECGTCGFKVSATEKRMDFEMYDHILSKHLDVYRCLRCGVVSETYRKYKIHSERRCKRSDKYKCDICEKILHDDWALRRHKFLHMNEEEKQQEIAKGFKPYRKRTELAFQCQTCGKGFVTKSQLEKHLETHKSRDEREKHICPVCGKAFLRGGWQSHLKMGCGREHDPPVQCLICNATLKHRHSLRAHMRNLHQENDAVTCEQCGKSFKTAASLRSHQLVHTDLRPYQCDDCGAAFKNSYSVMRHKKTCKAGGRGNQKVS